MYLDLINSANISLKANLVSKLHVNLHTDKTKLKFGNYVEEKVSLLVENYEIM